ncbi:hypothetical protein B5X24_HaOG210222 [Helicoverpa armigera]|nr:hypothetical protein B5X24_HaOG210222 [Helicoverpa armigera]
MSCDQSSYNCMYGRCTICEHFKLGNSLVGEALLKTVRWEQWERVDHSYEKMEKGVLKKYITKKTIKNQKHGKLAELKQIFEKNIPLYKIHIYNFKHQQTKYREKIQTLGPHEAVILCDFSENYECKLHQEVQATHFGASKNQITLHCGMIYWASGSQSFCSVSDNKCHEPGAIWAHLLPVIKLLKSKCPDIKRIHFFSDGPSSQYRQKKNFFLLNFYTTELGLDMCTWNFSESGHGKGVADGIGGSVKRTLDKQVAYNWDITNGKEAFEMLKSVSKSIQFFFIEDSDIQMVQEHVPIDLKPIPRTMQIHQIISFANSTYLLNRLLSCFCKIEKESETCNCYELKKHVIQNSPVNIEPSNTMLPSTSKITSTLTDPLLINLDPVQNEDTESSVLDNYLIIAETMTPDLPILYLNNSSPDITENYSWDGKFTECFTETVSESIVPDEDRDGKIEAGSSSQPTDAKEQKFEEVHAPVITVPLKETQIINKINIYDSQNNSKKASHQNAGNSSHSGFKRPASSTMFTQNVAKKNRSDSKENKNPSIKTVISRSLACYACKKNTKFPSVDVTKCISCKQWFCINCSEGNNHIDFICRKCFGEEYIL